MDLGPHAGFIWGAYAAVLLILGLLILWLVADGKRQERRLDELEARGVRRRSGGQPLSPDPSRGSK
jgi:heme exporter protein D